MNYASSQVATQIGRVGREATVFIESGTAENDFGNSGSEYTSDRVVLAVRTYPNRNTEYESDAGTLQGDNPVFMIPVADDQPEPPQEGSRIEYDGEKYEVGSHTVYDTHIEFFGDQIIND